MTKRLLIDASHAEETRVVVLDGNRLEDFDVETQSRRQLKGNIYLAKVVRVEPSLQAAFVEYGGNRHGFLAFGEIHPDYYQIPVADRQRLIAMQEEEARAEEEEEDDDAPAPEARPFEAPAFADSVSEDGASSGTGSAEVGAYAADALPDGSDASGFETALFEHEAAASVIEHAPEPRDADEARPAEAAPRDADGAQPDASASETQPLLIGANVLHSEVQPDTSASLHDDAADTGVDAAPEMAEPAFADTVEQAFAEIAEPGLADAADQPAQADAFEPGHRVRQVQAGEAPQPEMLGGENDTGEETRAPRQTPRFMRSYKIQEVIRRRQILLIQVVKEERGTKGAALTTYISLAGRYCVLMPNSPRGGGISRKITQAADRRRLKEVTAELDIPRGMGLIVRTAGAARPKPEIKRDGEYLLRLWDDIREKTMQSMAPSMIHEEASLIKRAIRDVYSRDVDELLVDGIEGWRAARDYMRMLMPTHVKKVQLWPANAQPLFAHSQVESMLDAMLNPTVQLRSGGYLVINQTEALVAIDVNSGRSTRERGIEETALRTNMEAAEEAARQLRLRDLAGLIVIDFIDMESKKHNAMVERQMSDALRADRARIQIGHISHFGLLELSRQRLRPSLAETSLNVCAQCGGTGHVRSTESAALHVLREIEEEGGKRRAAEIQVHVASSTALYILNNKRERLTEIEARYAMRVCFSPDESLLPAQTRIDRLRAAVPQDLPPALITAQPMPDDDADEADIADEEDDVVMHPAVEAAAPAPTATPAGDFTTDSDHVPGETAAEGEQRRRRRRRRRRGRRDENGADAAAAPGLDEAAPDLEGADQPDLPTLALPGDEEMHATPGDDAAQAPHAYDGTQVSPAYEETGPSPVGDETSALTAGSAASALRTEGEMPVGRQDTDDIPAENAASERTGEAVQPPLALEPEAAEGEPARAKRGRRGGRRRRKPGEESEASLSSDAPVEAPAFEPAPAYVPYVGPTPADPFALGGGMDIFDALEQAELNPGNRVVAEAPQPPAEMDNAPATGPVLVGAAGVTAPAKKGWWRR